MLSGLKDIYSIITYIMGMVSLLIEKFDVTKRTLMLWKHTPDIHNVINNGGKRRRLLSSVSCHIDDSCCQQLPLQSAVVCTTAALRRFL